MRSDLNARSLWRWARRCWRCFLTVCALACGGSAARARRRMRPRGRVYTQTNNPQPATRWSCSTAPTDGTLQAGGRQHRRQRQHAERRLRPRLSDPRLTDRGRRSSDGKFVFAVNAGSDTVTSFRETNSGLKLGRPGVLRRRHAGEPGARRATCSTSSTLPRERQRHHGQHLRPALLLGRPTVARGSSQPLALWHRRFALRTRARLASAPPARCSS